MRSLAISEKTEIQGSEGKQGIRLMCLGDNKFKILQENNNEMKSNFTQYLDNGLPMINNLVYNPIAAEPKGFTFKMKLYSLK